MADPKTRVIDRLRLELQQCRLKLASAESERDRYWSQVSRAHQERDTVGSKLRRIQGILNGEA